MEVKWKWRCRVLLYRFRLWSLLSTLRLVYSYWRKQPHETEFGFLANFNGAEGLLIDIGANAGQSVVSSRIFNKSYSIISFEPNVSHKMDLQRIKTLFGFNKFEYHLVGLGDKRESQHFFVPVVQGVPLSQEATLSKKCLMEDQITQNRIFELTGQSKFQIEETDITLKTLDDYELSPDFVKLDVQLSEVKVLKGMSSTIQRSHPILMIENGPYLLSIILYLDSYGYKPFQYNQKQNRLEPTGENATSMNVFFVPNARRNWLGPLICEEDNPIYTRINLL